MDTTVLFLLTLGQPVAMADATLINGHSITDQYLGIARRVAMADATLINGHSIDDHHSCFLAHVAMADATLINGHLTGQLPVDAAE